MSIFIRKPRNEYVRLIGTSLWVPTDEQLEKAANTARQNGRNPRKPTLSLRVECEPLSYKFVDENGVAQPEQRVFKYYPMTYGLTDEDLAGAREHGLNGINPNRIITAGQGGGPEAEKDVFPRWLKYLNAAGFDLDVDEAGQPVTNAAGKVFRVTEGEDVFPGSRQDPKTGKWVNTDALGKPITFTLRNIMYLVEADANYVQDPESVRVITVRQRDEESDAAAASSISSGVDTVGALRTAAIASGLVGKNIKEVSTARQQLAFCDGSIAVAPIFVTDEVNAAAAGGKLIDYLLSKDAIGVAEDGTITGVE